MLPELTEPLSRFSTNRILKACEKVRLGNETPQELVSAVKKLNRIFFISAKVPDLYIQFGHFTTDSMFDTRFDDNPAYKNHNFWNEAKVLMDEFNLPPNIRKAFLMSLIYYPIFQDIDMRQSYTNPSELNQTLILNAINILCSHDFNKKVDSNLKIRLDFFFLLANYMFQWNPLIYNDESLNDWSVSRRVRKEYIENEKVSGKKFLTVFLSNNNDKIT